MLEIIMAHFEAEIDISKCKICIRHTFLTTFSEITEKVVLYIFPLGSVPQYGIG